MTPEEKARILIQEINEALARGTQHYTRAGQLLETPKAIIKCLLLEGGLTFRPSDPSDPPLYPVGCTTVLPDA